MQFYTYKITNLINGKIYVGVHKTTNLEDGYMGSGVALNRAISKYGIGQFKKDILMFHPSETEMFEVEALIVDQEFVNRPDTYNLKLGGEGSWSHINSVPMRQSQKDAISLGLINTNKKIGWAYGNSYHGFKDKKHSAESKRKISENNANTLPKEVHKYRKDVLSKYDMTKRGSLSKFSREIGVSHTQARRIIDNFNSV